jgi:hypothetical protein
MVRLQTDRQTDTGEFPPPDPILTSLGNTKALSKMYTHISIDGINPVNDCSTLNSLSSSYLADIIT